MRITRSVRLQLGNRYRSGIVLLSKRSFTILFVIAISVSVCAAVPPSAEVVVLCALHQLHEQVPYYSCADLAAAIERLHPDVLAVELTRADLKEKAEQKNKREYQNSVYPLLQKHPWLTVALEPEGPRRSELIALMRESEDALQKASPQKDEAFDTYNDQLFQYLLSHWHTSADVNAPWTDGCLQSNMNFRTHCTDRRKPEAGRGGINTFSIGSSLLPNRIPDAESL